MKIEDIEYMLDEAEIEASKTDIRYTADEVFGRVKKLIHEPYSKHNTDDLSNTSLT